MTQRSNNSSRLGGNPEPYEKINTLKLNEELQSLEGSIIIELFEIDTARYGGQIYRFHAGEIVKGEISFGGKSYSPFPLEVEGFEIKGDGTLPRPKMTLSNVDGFVSNIINGKDDFVGLKTTRIRTFLKYLDESNFIDNINPFGAPDETAKFPNETYFINRKVSEDKYSVQFELSSELELESVQLPSRTIHANYCPWIYRGKGCNYGNTSVHTVDDWYNIIENGEVAPNVFGWPIADSNNNKFNGPIYNISTAGNAPWKSDWDTPYSDSGFYDATGIYTSGDYVRIPSTENNEVMLYFVARPTGIMAQKAGDPTYNVTYNNVSGKDPRNDTANWVQDQCSKNLTGCLLRFQYSTKGLPYGGFPGTERFPYG
tara:strand:+ start:383 stop:1495 length:1113 start_codon:yes stop_codon:yes gene_type:complete